MNVRSGLMAALLILSCSGFGQDWPQTRAERTQYAETSHYDDVVAFLRDLQKLSPALRVETIGTSSHGHPMPLAIASFPPVASAIEARRLGKPVVYVQANIHAGEVEGKEAILAILRRLLQAGPKGPLGKMVLVTTPIYNIDGNEMFGPAEVNRSEQDGPALVGHRESGQGFDLNRDAIKAEAFETQAVLDHVYKTWDPDVMMDLHTTDGTRHGWELTYSPPLDPNTETHAMRLARDVILPEMRRKLAKENGLPLFDYGNLEGSADKQGWYTFGFEGRYCTNYVGLRNRIGLLSEATAYIPFKDRVQVTDLFVSGVIDWVSAHAKTVIDTSRRADEEVVAWGQDPSKAPALGVRFGFDTRGKEAVLLEKKGSKHTLTSRPTEIVKPVLPVFDRFKATKTTWFPAGYLIPADQTRLIQLLERHGIQYEWVVAPWRGEAEQFAIDKVDQASRPFQGHKLVTLDGEFHAVNSEFPDGFILVRTAQPLGILAFHILEPEGTDGAAAWGVIDGPLAVGRPFPVLKLKSTAGIVGDLATPHLAK